MTREETKRILHYIISSGAMFRSPDMQDTLSVWHDMLKEYDYRAVQEATRAAVATNTSGFAPSVGQIIEKLHIKDSFEELNPMEAWALVSKALRRSFYYAKEEFAKLPDLVQQVVGSPENLKNWATTDAESVENVLQSNFQRNYRTMMERKKAYNRMPETTRALIDSVLPAKISTKGEEMVKLTDGAEKEPEMQNTMPQWAMDKIREMKGE